MHLSLPVHGLLHTSISCESEMDNRVNQILELDENRRMACEQNCKNQEKFKMAFDKTTRKIFLLLGIHFCCGIKEGKIQESTINLISCGWVHLSSGIK